MEQLKNSNIIILPTDDKPTLGTILYRKAFDCISLWRYKETHTYKDGTKVYRTLGGSFEDWYKGLKPHYVYVISDEIKEGDFKNGEFYYHINFNYIFKKGSEEDNDFTFKNCKKIISTTDTSLGLGFPPEEDIDNFVKDYNKEFKKDLNITIEKPSNYKEKFRLALLQLKDYSDNELIIQEGLTLNINEELNELL